MKFTIHSRRLIGYLDVSHEFIFHRGPHFIVPLLPSVSQLHVIPRIAHYPEYVWVQFEVAKESFVIVKWANSNVTVNILHFRDKMINLQQICVQE
jgi:hypothetical protein